MEKDPVKLRHLYAGWETEDLKKAITVNKAGYEPWAINIIREELRSRDVNTEELDSSAEDIDRSHKNFFREEESFKNEGKLFCPKCHSLKIITKKWKWSYLLVIPFFGVCWLLFEYINMSLLQLPLCILLVYMWIHRMKYQCGDCGYRFNLKRSIVKVDSSKSPFKNERTEKWKGISETNQVRK